MKCSPIGLAWAWWEYLMASLLDRWFRPIAAEPEFKTFDEWWNRDGRYIDPDTEDVPWFDKRKELAALAFDAGALKRKGAKP